MGSMYLRVRREGEGVEGGELDRIILALVLFYRPGAVSGSS